MANVRTQCPPGQAERPARLVDIDWPEWTPVERATLVFVQRRGQLLLIHKLRGLGAGKISAPGGRIEPGESPAECALREVQEEVCVTPTGLCWAGEHSFQFVDGHSIHVDVFRADGCEGEPRETEEARPFWVSQAAIPYDEMWEDDRLWVPALLRGERFQGRFLFEGDRMLDHVLEIRTD